MIMTAEQLRAGRAMLRLEQGALADMAGVSSETIKRFEAMSGPLRGRQETVSSIREAMEFAGLHFIFDDTSIGQLGVGVRMAENPESKFRARVLEVVNESAELVVDSELKADSELYKKGPDYIARLLIEKLPRWLPSRMVQSFGFVTDTIKRSR